MKSNRSALMILAVSLIIVMLGFGIAIPLMPFYIIHFDASGMAMGLTIALYSLMQFIFAPVWGRLSDQVGRKPVLMIGVAGYAAAFFLQGISPNLYWFIGSRTLAGILSSAALPTAMAYVADTTSPEDRAPAAGCLGLRWALG
ncbi:MAG: MFS transporter [Anaerolineales bacterium]|nr:MFS transporter [Anaerolineales bacterium]